MSELTDKMKLYVSKYKNNGISNIFSDLLLDEEDVETLDITIIDEELTRARYHKNYITDSEIKKWNKIYYGRK